MSLPTVPINGQRYKGFQYIFSLGAWIQIELPAINEHYVQYPGEDDPATFWPGTSWSNISGDFTGEFERVEGGAAATFNSAVQAYALQNHRHTYSYDGVVQDAHNGGTSGGYNNTPVSTSTSNPNSATTDTAEVRPVNQSIRLWKRLS